MAQLVMVEGLPGSGKTTASGFINGWLVDRHVPVHHFTEGRTDHPVDLEQVAVLTGLQLARLRSDLPDEADGDWGRHRAALAALLEDRVDPRALAPAAPVLTSGTGQRASTR